MFFKKAKKKTPREIWEDLVRDTFEIYRFQDGQIIGTLNPTDRMALPFKFYDVQTMDKIPSLLRKSRHLVLKSKITDEYANVADDRIKSYKIDREQKIIYIETLRWSDLRSKFIVYKDEIKY